jgi:hypothetical protein
MDRKDHCQKTFKQTTFVEAGYIQMSSQSDPDKSQGGHSRMDNRAFQFVIRLSGLLLPFVNRTNGKLVSLGRSPVFQAEGKWKRYYFCF